MSRRRQVCCQSCVEDHHITHALIVVSVVECLQPIVEWDFTDALGAAGVPEQLEISDRSQEALEVLGIVFKSEEDDVKDELPGSRLSDRSSCRNLRPKSPLL